MNRTAGKSTYPRRSASRVYLFEVLDQWRQFKARQGLRTNADVKPKNTPNRTYGEYTILFIYKIDSSKVSYQNYEVYVMRMVWNECYLHLQISLYSVAKYPLRHTRLWKQWTHCHCRLVLVVKICHNRKPILLHLYQVSIIISLFSSNCKCCLLICWGFFSQFVVQHQ